MHNVIGQVIKGHTFATDFNTDSALLLTSLESSCMANTIDGIISECALVFEGSLRV